MNSTARRGNQNGFASACSATCDRRSARDAFHGRGGGGGDPFELAGP
jgi:hypothetical protein